MNKYSVFLLIGIFLLSFTSALTSPILSPSEVKSGNFVATTLNGSYDELVNAWYATSSNVTKVFNNQVYSPWYSSSSSCAIANLKTDCYASPNMTAFCMVTDEFSVLGVGLSMGINETRFDQFYNTLSNLNQSVGAGTLPAWRLSINGGTVESYLNDTASDADARIIIALYNAANNSYFTQANRTKYRNLANQMSQDFVRYDLITATKFSSLGQGNITYHMITGRNIGINGAEGLGYGSAMYSGYYQDGIIAMTQAYVNTGNQTYLNILRNLTLDYMEAAKFNGVDFSVPPTAFEWDNLTGIMTVTCSRDCSPDAHWDDADAPRLSGLGMVEYYANITGITIPLLTAYNNAWRTEHAQQYDSWVYRYWLNGSAYGTTQSGYKAQSLQSQLLSGSTNVSLFNNTLRSALSHFTSSTQSMDSASCMGLYSPGMTIRALGMSIGRDAGSYSAMNGSSPSGNLNCSVNGILFTLFNPVNASSILGNSATFSFSVTNNNVSNVTDTTPYLYYNYTNFSTAGFTGGSVTPQGWLNITDDIFTSDQGLSNYNVFMIVDKGKVGQLVPNNGFLKLYAVAPYLSAGSGDNLFFDGQADGTISGKQAPDYYPNWIDGMGNNSNYTRYTIINKTSNKLSVNFSWTNGTNSGSSGFVNYTMSTNMNSSFANNWSAITLDGSTSGEFLLYNWQVWNLGTPLTHPGDSNANITIYANGISINSTNNLVSGTTYNYTWNSPEIGFNSWYVNAVTTNNNVISCEPEFYIAPYTNITTMCNSNGTCINVTSGSTYNVGENANLTITSDRDTAWYFRWWKDFVIVLEGWGENVYNFIANNPSSNPTSNITLQTYPNSASAYPTPTAVANLVAYYRMDDNTTTTNVVDYTGVNNGTLINGGNTSGSSVTGQYLGALNFDGVNGYVSSNTNVNVTGNASFSMCTWFNSKANATASAASQPILSASNMYIYIRNSTYSNQLIFRYSDGVAAKEVNYLTNLNLNQWYQVCGVYNYINSTGINESIYVNGVVRQTILQNNRSSVLASSVINIGLQGVGRFNGSIDEVRIYNKSLNASEVSQIYNEQLGLFESWNISTNSTNPRVNITYPLNLVNIEGTTALVNTTLNWTVSDYNISSCWYSINGGVTNTSVTCNNNQTALNNLAKGYYDVRFYANDTVGNFNYSSINMSINNQAPVMNVISPLSQTYSSLSTLFNVSVTDVGIDKVLYSLDGQANITLTNVSSYYSATNSSMTKGVHTVVYYANDTSGNSVSSSVTFTTDNTDWASLGLVAHYNMDDNATNTIVNDQTGRNIGTLVNAGNTSNVSVVGKINGALQFDGVNDYVNISNNVNTSSFNTNGFTVSAWINSSSWNLTWAGNLTNIVDCHTTGGFEFRKTQTNSTSFRIGLNINNGTTNLGATSITYRNLNQYYHIVGVYNTTHSYIYVDGILDSSFTSVNLIGNNNNQCGIGTYMPTPSTRLWNGSIDDVRIYNRTLSQSEITALYNSGIGTQTATYYNVSNNVSIIGNGSNISIAENGNVTFTSEAPLSRFFTWIKDGVSVLSGWGVNVATIFFPNLASSPNSTVNLVTNYSNGTLASNVTFNVNTNSSNPLISFVAPTLNNDTLSGNNWVYANVSVQEINLVNLTYNLYYSNGTVRNSTTYTSVQGINWTNLADGNYSYNVTARDIVGNTNSTETRLIRLDASNPVLNITYPLNTTYTTYVTQLNYTNTESYPDSCWYSNDDGVTNQSIGTCLNTFTITPSLGSNTYTVYANDTLGHLNSTSRTFYINMTNLSSINISYITNGTANFTGTNISVNENSNLTFVENGSTTTNFLDVWFTWTVDYVVKAFGYGVYSFNYLFNNTASDPSSTVSLVLNNQTTVCYQESANTTNQSGTDNCAGMNYGGSYSWTGAWNSLGQGYDGNWNTIQSTDCGLGVSDPCYTTLIASYKKPTGAINATFKFKDSLSNTLTYNIPQTCFDLYSDRVNIYMDSYNYPLQVVIRCDGATIDTRGGSGIFEEAINWTIGAGTWTINTNSQNPNINIVYPANGVTYSQPTALTQFNFTFNDATAVSCMYWNGYLTFIGACANQTGYLSTEGLNTWNVSIIDAVGNINSSQTSFTWVKTAYNSSNVIYQCGVINQPGNYIINQSLSDASDCITITSNDVFIDANAKLISAGFPSGPMNAFKGTNVNNVTIMNVNTYSALTVTGNNNSLLYNNSFGNISYPSIPAKIDGNMSWNGGSSGNIIISNNLVSVNSNNITALNTTANITLNKGATTYPAPFIRRNAEACPSSICTQYTSNLNDAVVTFGVTQFTNYSISGTPVIVIDNPTTIINYGYLGKNETLNFTVTDDNLDKVWYNYNGTNITVSAVSAIPNIAYLTLTSKKNLTVYANDTDGNFNSLTKSWDYAVFENNVTYTNPVLEGQTNYVGGYFTMLNAPTSVIFNYNAVNSTPVVTNYIGNEYLLNSTVIAPEVSSVTNISLFYYFVINGSVISSRSLNQSVQEIIISNNCSVGNYPFLNISNFEEDLLVPINGTVEYTLSLKNNNLVINSVNGSNTGTTASLCSSVNLTSSYATYDLELRYYKNDSSSYAYETYNIIDSSTTNLPMSIPLYFLNLSSGNKFTINYLDFFYIEHPGAIIQVQRQYLANANYLLVEAPRIADGGSSFASFNTNNIRYKLIVIERGVVLDTFDNVFPVCQNALLNQCELNLRGLDNVTTETDGDFTYTLVTDQNNLTLTYVIPSGTPRSITLSTNQNSRFLTNISNCNSSIFASGGTITCEFNDTVGDSLLDVVITNSGADPLYGTIHISEDLTGFYLLNNYFIAFILLLTLVMLFISSGVMMVIVSVIGIMYLGAIFLLRGVDPITVSSSVAWLIVGAIMIIYKIAQKEERT